MSIKIYEAYRLKENVDLWSFIRSARKTATLKLEEIISQLYTKWIENKDFHDVIRNELSFPNDYNIDILATSMFLNIKYREQSGNPNRNFYNLDSSFTIHEYQGRYYIIPYTDFLTKETLMFFKTHPDLESFHYWNNVDPDENVDESEWNKRGEIWDNICDDWDNFVSVEICSIDSFYKIDPIIKLLER